MRPYRQIGLLFAALVAISMLLPACEALRDGVGKTDFWADR